jgi:hypothetical protein
VLHHGVKGDLPESNEMRVLGNKSISLASIPQPEDSNTMGVESKEAGVLLYLMDNVVIDVM